MTIVGPGGIGKTTVAQAIAVAAGMDEDPPIFAGPPLFFHHGWPLSADDWDAQMMFFLARGFRVLAHDCRGHGRSSQTIDGHDMDTYAADVAQLVAELDLRGAVHIGHSSGGGEVTRYVARHGNGRVKKAVLISAIPPTFMQSAKNPDGVPKEVVDGIREGTAYHRSQFYKEPLLRLQPARRGRLRGYSRELVAAGYDGRDQGPARVHPSDTDSRSEAARRAAAVP